jgi:hypothetical protein
MQLRTRINLSWLWLVLPLLSCQSAPGKAAIDGPDPLHSEPLKQAPAEAGLPPNPIALAMHSSETFAVAKPPISEDMWPCTTCHDGNDVNRNRRVLKEEHTNIQLHHDEEHRWCLDCHDATNRDYLHLASGVTITFDESYKLCGQCHGDKYRDWRMGVHGKRTGQWNGEKQYLLCVHCHSPHEPHFKPLKPEAPPARPTSIR